MNVRRISKVIVDVVGTRGWGQRLCKRDSKRERESKKWTMSNGMT